jgi:Domain of unknown function (DUF4956)
MKIQPLFNEIFLIRFLINTGAMIILIRFIYYHIYQKREIFFTFFLLNFVVFILAFMLQKSTAFGSISNAGTAFGLLAAFSLLRFRTETISAKDMTYIFIIMTIALINSIMDGQYWEIIILDSLIIAAVYVVDGNWLMRNQKTKMVDYEGIDNIKPDNHPLLIKDLCQRTGLNIQKISIEHIDLIKNRVEIKIYYH